MPIPNLMYGDEVDVLVNPDEISVAKDYEEMTSKKRRA